MIRGPEKRESSGHSLLLLLFALDIPFTRDEPPRRQLISGQEVTSASLETDPSTPPTSSLQAQPRALLYRFADHREFEFSDSEMSRMILLWGFKRPSPPLTPLLRNADSSVKRHFLLLFLPPPLHTLLLPEDFAEQILRHVALSIVLHIREAHQMVFNSL